MSKFGIIEMTRQKRGTRTSTLVSENCHLCYGSGLVTKKEIICYELLRKIIAQTNSSKKEKIKISINPNLIQTIDKIIENNKNHRDIKKLDINLFEDSSINQYEIS